MQQILLDFTFDNSVCLWLNAALKLAFAPKVSKEPVVFIAQEP